MIWIPALVAALVYANSLANDFVYDDAIVLGWLDTRRWDPVGFLTQPRGLTYALHALDRALWGEAPLGFHLTNVLLHVAATALAAVAARRLTGSARAGILCGLAFAVHPVHAEAVANVSNRKDLLATLLALLAAATWAGGRRTWPRTLGVLTAFALGMYAKEAAVAGLPLALVAADVLLGDRGRSSAARLRTSLLHVSPLLAIGGLAVLAFGGPLGALFSPEAIAAKSDGAYDTWSRSLATGIACWPQALRLLLFPLHLAIDYGPSPQQGFGSVPVILGVSLACSVLIAAAALARRAPLATFGLLWTVSLYLPVSNVLPLHHILLAERYLYAPSFGICLLFGVVVDRGLRRAPSASLPHAAIAAVTASLLVAGAFRSVVRNLDWRDWPALLAAADRDGVDTWRVHKSAGAWAVREEDHAEAARRYRRAVDLRPADPELHFWLGVCLHRLGDLDAALAEYEVTLSMRPLDAKAHYHVGLILIQKQDLKGAVEHLRETTRLDPAYSLAHYNLGVALTLLGDLDGAVLALEQTTRLEPESAEAHLNLGAVLKARGDLERALSVLEIARDLNPIDPHIHGELGTVLVRLGREAQAAESFRTALEHTTDPAARRQLEAMLAGRTGGGE